MNKKIRYTILLVVFLVSIINVYPQTTTQHKQDLKTTFQKFDTTKNFISRNNIRVVLSKELSIPSEYEFKANNPAKPNVELEKDEFGFTHERFVQFYKGIKVEYSDIRVHSKNGSVVSVNGDYTNAADINIIPILEKDEAITKALQFVKAKKYRWEIPSENIWLQDITNNKNATFYPCPELVICKNHLDLKDSTFHLAYKMDIYAIEPLSRNYIYVDSNNGSIINAETIIKSIVGNAQTRYSGYLPISTKQRSSDFILKDDSRGNGIETKNLQLSEEYSDAVEFTDNDNNWVEHGSNKDNAALDAHWGAMKTYDYFKNIHNRNSFDNQGAIIRNFVHFGYQVNNAYWSGYPDNVMFFGDGDGIKYDALTCLGVTAHELSHAICQYTANLQYQGESGAINEGLSDIWAACVESYAAPDKSIWLCGDEILRNGHASVRSMSNPNSELQPDTYGSPSYWVDQNGCIPSESNDYCGVHTNSGVMNYWFYLLVNGGVGTNDIGHAFNTIGIGIDKAAKIVYRSETIYMTQSTFYSTARTNMIDAAIDLFGDNSPEVVAVTNSWYAVGVGSSFSCDDWTTIFDENYTVNTNIPACNIDIYDATVTNGAKLTLDVFNETIIYGPFEVALSSQFEIK